MCVGVCVCATTGHVQCFLCFLMFSMGAVEKERVRHVRMCDVFIRDGADVCLPIVCLPCVNNNTLHMAYVNTSSCSRIHDVCPCYGRQALE